MTEEPQQKLNLICQPDVGYMVIDRGGANLIA